MAYVEAQEDDRGDPDADDDQGPDGPSCLWADGRVGGLCNSWGNEVIIRAAVKCWEGCNVFHCNEALETPDNAGCHQSDLGLWPGFMWAPTRWSSEKCFVQWYSSECVKKFVLQQVWKLQIDTAGGAVPIMHFRCSDAPFSRQAEYA